MIKCIYKILLLAFLSAIKTDAIAAEGKVIPTGLLGTGPLSLVGNSKVLLENMTVANQIVMLDTSTFSIRSGMVAALSGVISGADMKLETHRCGFGTIQIQGCSSNYKNNIIARNVNLLINGTVGANVTVKDSMLGGTGFMGDVMLESKSVIKPGGLPGAAVSDIYVNSLVAQSAVKHYVEVNADTQASQIYVTNDIFLSDDFTVNVLLKAGTYSAGTVDYPIMTSRTGRLITDSKKTLNWTAQSTGDGSDLLTFNLGLSADGTQLILQSVIKQAFTLTEDEATQPQSKSTAVSAGSRLAVKGAPAAQTPIYVNDQVTVSTEMLTSLPSGKPLNITGGTILNDRGVPQTITTPINLTGTSAINTSAGAETIITTPITSESGTTLNLGGGGITTFLGDNSSTLQGDISVAGSTVNIGSGANLGSGGLNLSGEGTTVNLGTNSGDSVFLENIVTVSDQAAFVTPPGATSTFGKAIVGAADLNFDGGGKVHLIEDSPEYTGTLNANSGKVAMNSAMPQANVSIGTDAILSGNGTMKDVVLSGKLKPGNSIGTHYMDSLTTMSGASYDLEMNQLGESSKVFVTNDATLNGTFVVRSLLNAGNYPAGVIDCPILVTGNVLTIDTLNIKWNARPANGLRFTGGKLSAPGSAYDEKALILRYIADTPFTIDSDQTEIVDEAEITLIGSPTITVDYGDIVAPESILIVPNAPIEAASAPVAEQVELTNLVFQNNPSSQNVSATITSDAFRFKGSSSMSTTSGGGAVETLLTAISKNGPITYEKNNTHLWVSPYINRSRTNRTDSNVGNQGWSGGSVMGIEKRHPKKLWSVGLLTGLMGSRSHSIGDPNTFSKTKSLLLGTFNTYRYTKNWSHELLLTRNSTFVDAQRYGLDLADQKTPFYALGSYKRSTNLANGQLNYLFDVIKQSVTCRLDAGATYVSTQSGKFSERNAGENGINTLASLNKSIEYYGGIGLRKMWKGDNVTIRTTFVYEYGYQAQNSGTEVVKTTQSVAPTTFTTPPGPRQNKHYLQLNTSYLDKGTGLKFIASYSGALYKNVQNHTGMLKVEFRF